MSNTHYSDFAECCHIRFFTRICDGLACAQSQLLRLRSVTLSIVFAMGGRGLFTIFPQYLHIWICGISFSKANRTIDQSNNNPTNYSRRLQSAYVYQIRPAKWIEWPHSQRIVWPSRTVLLFWLRVQVRVQVCVRVFCAVCAGRTHQHEWVQWSAVCARSGRQWRLVHAAHAGRIGVRLADRCVHHVGRPVRHPVAVAQLAEEPARHPAAFRQPAADHATVQSTEASAAIRYVPIEFRTYSIMCHIYAERRGWFCPRVRNRSGSKIHSRIASQLHPTNSCFHSACSMRSKCLCVFWCPVAKNRWALVWSCTTICESDWRTQLTFVVVVGKGGRIVHYNFVETV